MLDVATDRGPVKGFWVKMNSNFVMWVEGGFLGKSFRSNKVKPRAANANCTSASREGGREPCRELQHGFLQEFLEASLLSTFTIDEAPTGKP